MSDEYQLEATEFYSLKTAAQKIFEMITKHLDVQTAYITKRGEDEITVLSSLNKLDQLAPEGSSMDYSESHCRLILKSQDNFLTTNNLMEDERTRDMEASAQLQVKGYLGVTLRDLKGEVFGTLCVMDKQERKFDQEDIEFLESTAAILSHMIELDQTQYNMSLLNVPIIPITKGVSILTLQGIIDEQRAEKILTNVLKYGAQNDIDYFIIDLSGLVIRDKRFPQVIANLVKSLNIMGIATILTGIKPEIAQQEMANMNLNESKPKTVSNLEAALSYIGFKLVVQH